MEYWLVTMPDPLVPGRAEAHEAGHAVAAAALGIPASAITVAAADQADAMRVGGFVRAESTLFTTSKAVHITIPIPTDLPATTWAHAMFLLAGLAAELASTEPGSLPVHPRILQYTAADDLRLISELFQVECTPRNRWLDLVDATVDLVFKHWSAISAVRAALDSYQQIEVQRVIDLVTTPSDPTTAPNQTRMWVRNQLLETVKLYQGKQNNPTAHAEP